MRMFQANRKLLLNVVLIPVSGGKITSFSTENIGLIKPPVDRPSVPDSRMIKVLQATIANTGLGLSPASASTCGGSVASKMGGVSRRCLSEMV
jgi:hypothetical protein